MRPILTLVLVALVGAVLSGCSHSPSGDGDRAAIDTTHGCILIEFFGDDAPRTVENFVQYAEDGFYERTIFHRIIQGFMIQGGGFTPDGQQKQTRDPIPLEYEVENERGTVAMARTNDPDSATSQFFVNTVDNTDSLGPNARGPGYTVFARVVEGMDVVDEISAQPTGTGPAGQPDWPNDPPIIEGVRVDGECGEREEEEEEEPVYGVEVGLMANTQENETWETRISAAEDHVPFWVLNTGNQADAFNLSLEAPADWNVSIDAETAETGASGRAGDATARYLTIQVDPEAGTTEPGVITVTVTSQSDPDASAVLEVRPVFDDPFVDSVSTVADLVSLQYAGTFDSGEEFDSGNFETTVKSGQTVPGFDTGLLGIAEGETIHLRFPPELGYGYNPGGGRDQFAGEWLNFEITVDSVN